MSSDTWIGNETKHVSSGTKVESFLTQSRMGGKGFTTTGTGQPRDAHGGNGGAHYLGQTKASLQPRVSITYGLYSPVRSLQNNAPATTLCNVSYVRTQETNDALNLVMEKVISCKTFLRFFFFSC